MNEKTKKTLMITGVVVDVAITVVLFVISIIMLVCSVKMNTMEQAERMAFVDDQNALFRFLLGSKTGNTVYFWAFVFPLFLLLALNIFILVMYVRKTTKKEPVKVNDLSAEQKEALRRELLQDLQNEAIENKEEE